MSNNTVKARVQVKADTSANWALYGDGIIPLLREPIFYSDTGQIKLGDGVRNVNQLPFFIQSGGGSDGMNCFIGDTEPTEASVGDIWLDTSDMETLYAAEEVEF